MKKIFLILFLGLIALICGPPKLFASAKSTTVEKSLIYIEASLASASANKQFCLTKTVAADQKPILPEYTGNTTNFTLLPGDPFAKLLDIGFLYIETKYLKNTLIPGFGRRLHQEA